MKNATLIIGVLLVGVMLFGCTAVSTNSTNQSYVPLWGGAEQCKVLAGEVIPKYIFISEHIPDRDTGSGSEGMSLSLEAQSFRWKDNTSITLASVNPAFPDSLALIGCFVGGTDSGENVNYLYFRDSTYCQGYSLSEAQTGLSYSKQINDASGTILGYRQFRIKPVLKEYDFHMNFTLVNETTLSFDWTGYNASVFTEAFGSSNMAFIVVSKNSKTDDITLFCEKNVTTPSGHVECDISNYIALTHTTYGFREKLLYYAPPVVKPYGSLLTGLYMNAIYEVIDPNIVYCNWVTDEGVVYK